MPSCTCDYATGECQAPVGCKAVAEIEQLRVQIKEGCQAARNFGGDVVEDDDEPKWCVAAAVVAERKRSEAEIERLRAALDPFVRHAHCTDQIERSSLALWCAQALDAVSDHEQKAREPE